MFNDELEAVNRSLLTIDNVKSRGNVIDGKARANKDVFLSGHIEFELMLANAGFPWAEEIFEVQFCKEPHYIKFPPFLVQTKWISSCFRIEKHVDFSTLALITQKWIGVGDEIRWDDIN